MRQLLGRTPPLAYATALPHVHWELEWVSGDEPTRNANPFSNTMKNGDNFNDKIRTEVVGPSVLCSCNKRTARAYEPRQFGHADDITVT
jgi:hypothetical protein